MADDPSHQTPPRTRRASKRRPSRLALVLLYGIILIPSILSGPAARLQRISDIPDRVDIPMRRADGSIINDRSVQIDWDRYPPASPSDSHVPVLLLHGSPGDKSNFDELAPLIAHHGYDTYAISLPGNGDSSSAPDLSLETQARYALDVLSHFGIERAHVLGWSNGGAVAVHMAHQAPDRTASITMLASIGVQETEGSGSYAFEHFKYAVGIALIGYTPELIPHFGHFGSIEARTGWLWGFWDTDQRPMRAIMSALTTPTLILHGDDDFLVPYWAARTHHDVMQDNARLVMLDATHFMPFLQPELSAEYITAHLDRHNTPNVPPRTDTLDRSSMSGLDRPPGLLHTLGAWIGTIPWFLQIPLIALCARRFPLLTLTITTLFVGILRIDFGVALLALLIARVWQLTRTSNFLDRPRSVLTFIRALAFVPVAFIIAMLALAPFAAPARESNIIIALAAAIILAWLLNLLRLLPTRLGRARIRGEIDRITHHEYWPTLLIYAPVIARFLRWILTGKGIAFLTNVNPGFIKGGGVVDERKSDLQTRFAHTPEILELALIPSDTPDRAAHAKSLIESHPELGGYPIIAKPDQGQHGVGVKLIRDERALDRYLREHPGDTVLQRYHPGPVEVGIVWARDARTITDPDFQGPQGTITAINIKRLPTITGDGKHTVQSLIMRDRRLRRQMPALFRAVRDQLDDIPDQGEIITLGAAANHRQGATFLDGAHLITPELDSAITRIATGFKDDQGRRFDIGRFDVRCASPDDLARARNLGIVELNGITSEPTNMYDPDHPVTYAWRELGAYWSRVHDLAIARKSTNTGDPITHARIARLILENFRKLV